MATSNSSSLYDQCQIVCLDVQINDDDRRREILQSIKNISSFTDFDRCLDYVKDHWSAQIYLVVSDRLVSSVLPKLEELPQIVSVSILCKNTCSDELASICPDRSHSVFQNKDRLLSHLEAHIIEKTTFTSTLDWSLVEELNPRAVLPFSDVQTWSLLADMNNVMHAETNSSSRVFDKQRMIRECRRIFHNEQTRWKHIDKFAQDYNPSKAIKSYTTTTFLYEIVNQILRTQSSELIGKYRFYIKDLQESLDLHFAKQTSDYWSTTSTSQGQKLSYLYRGQVISTTDVEQLQSLCGQRVIMSQYTSTSTDLEVAEFFASAGNPSGSKIRVIFEIDASVIYESYIDKPDPTIYYYDISGLSSFTDENEILLRVGTVLQLERMEESSDGSWCVKLRLEKTDEHQTPLEIIDGFSRKASQWRKINTDYSQLSEDIMRRMSVFIRLGYLVRHHPREQLHYYQSALALLPSNESALRETGYWAIRMRCIASVNDWTCVPVKIYRQTVFHVDDSFRNQLNRELARIDEARGAFRSAARHCRQVQKHTRDKFEKEMMESDIERLKSKADDLQPVLPSGQVTPWHLYVTVLTPDERALVDHQCELLHQSIDKRNLSKHFSFKDILPKIDTKDYPELDDDGILCGDFDTYVLPVYHVFIKTVTDEPLAFDLDSNTTVRQLKEKIRAAFDLPYPANYDCRLIYWGRSLTDKDQTLVDCNGYDQCVMFVVHGPRTVGQPMTRLERELYENTGLNASNMKRTLVQAKRRANQQVIQAQKLQQMLTKFARNACADQAFVDLFREKLAASQPNEDEDADPHHLLDMSPDEAEEYIQNSGPNISAEELLNAFGGFAPRTHMEWNSDGHENQPNR